MDISAKPGHRVTLRDVNSEVGFDTDWEKACKYLDVHSVYTVKRITPVRFRAHFYHNVELEGYDEVFFNATLFKDAPAPKK